jgi:hypothetical protein
MNKTNRKQCVIFWGRGHAHLIGNRNHKFLGYVVELQVHIGDLGDGIMCSSDPLASSRPQWNHRSLIDLTPTMSPLTKKSNLFEGILFRMPKSLRESMNASAN